MNNSRRPDSPLRQPKVQKCDSKQLEHGVKGSIELEDKDGPIGKLEYTLTEDRQLQVVYTSYEGIPNLSNFTAWERRDG
jgi:hypothetical protein